MASKQTRTLLIFYLLAFYILLQFCWWAYYLTDLSEQLTALRIATGNGSDSPDALRNQLNNKTWMILGEGLVFLSLLALGIWKVQSNLRKETKLFKLQQNFLLSVTHEIKSPIAALRLSLETLSRRELPQEKQKQILNQSLQDADRLDLLADKIILAARMESSEQALYLEKINPAELIQQCIQQLSTAIGKDHETVFNCSSKSLIFGDALALRSLFANLYENAVKYAPKGSQISVDCSEDAHNFYLSVTDQGVGIPADERQLVFEKFYRSGNELTRSSKGTGLGLYIVKQIADGHKASIEIKNNSPQGAIFTVKFKKV